MRLPALAGSQWDLSTFFFVPHVCVGVNVLFVLMRLLDFDFACRVAVE